MGSGDSKNSDNNGEIVSNVKVDNNGYESRKIETTSSQSVKVKQYPIPFHLKDQLKEEIK